MATPFVYLASRSPRRRELLAQIGIAHRVLALDEGAGTGEVDETPQPAEAPVAYVERIALTKAKAGRERVVREKLPVRPLLAADTTVALDGRILGKPESAADAAAMLRTLSGRTHQVHTAVAAVRDGDIELAVSTSNVTMRKLSEQEIAQYVGTGEPMDKAGAYAIQGRAAIFIERIEGSYSGVMGLPLFETAKLLSGTGMLLP